jgi:hypothetical protein
MKRVFELTSLKKESLMNIRNLSKGLLGLGLGALLLGLVASPARAQNGQHYVDSTFSIAPLVAQSYSVDFGDVNNDGKPDIILGINGAQNRLYINAGGSAFIDETALRLPSAILTTVGTRFADLDGDGDLDIVVANKSQQSRIWINDGFGYFTDETSSRAPVASYDTIRAAVGDVTGDARPDIYFANFNNPTGQQNQLWINDGSGHFIVETGSRLPAVVDTSNSAIIVDVNKDGSNDIVVANATGQPERLYLNDGTGHFTEAPLPPRLGTGSTSVAATDVNSDGNIDLLFGNGGSAGPEQDQLLMGNGTGAFTDGTSSRLPSVGDATVDVRFGDVNQDGCPDIVVANFGQNRLYLNGKSGGLCTGVFTQVTTTNLPVDNANTRETRVGDLNGDGYPDIFFANINLANQLLFNDGTGKFESVSGQLSGRIPADTDNTTHAEAIDVDGDRDVDFVISARNQRVKVYINDGNGFFTDQTATRLPTGVYDTIRVAVDDLTGDGCPDIYLANFGTSPGQQNRLWINNCAGVFTDQTTTRLPNVIDQSQDAAIADVNGDGSPEIIVSNGGGQPNRVYLNNGTGTFTLSGSALPPNTGNSSTSVEVSDLNSDGFRDIIIGNGGGAGNQQNRIYINNGSGIFTDQTATRFPTFLDPTIDIKAGDVNNDTCPDILVANFNAQNRLYLNGKSGTTCTGVFTNATANLPAAVYPTGDVDFADVDLDGDLDIIVSNRNNQQNRLWINDGTGVFTDQTATRLPSDNNNTWDAAFGDVDHDGDLDLFMSNFAQQNRLYINILNTTPVQEPPVTNAGPDQTVVEPAYGAGADVTLDGSGSTDPDGDINQATFEWFEGTTLIATGKTPTVHFPAGVHTITLTVTDSQGLTSTDTVIITVNTAARPPVANAGPDQTVPEGTEVTLDGSGSSDPDGDIDAATFEWFEGTTLLGTGKIITYTFPVGAHTVILVVTDVQTLEDTDDAIITVNAGIPPTANAGPDQVWTESTPGAGWDVYLDGSGSTDDDGDINAATFEWYEGTTLIATGMTPAVHLATGIHTITLKVTDTQGFSATDSVVITVQGIQPPVANAGPDQTVTNGTPVTLDGSASFSPDGEIVSYEWFENYGQLDQTFLGNTAILVYTFPVGTHLVTLVVTDDYGQSATDTVTIVVTQATLSSTIMITPRALNVDSKGIPVNAMVTFSNGYNVNNINPATVILCIVCNGSDDVPAYQWTFGGSQFHAKFSRAAVELISPEGMVTYTVKGYLNNGAPWSGTDTIRVFKSSDKPH